MRRMIVVVVVGVSMLVPAVAPATGRPPAPAGAADQPGAPLKLTVDATEAPRKLIRAREIIPARPGPLTLHYPKWIPGEHGPTGPIVDLAGLEFTAAGRTLPWRRDPVDMYAFHLDVPDGARRVEVGLEYLAPSDGRFSAGPSTTDHLLVLSWHWVLLAPPGANDDIVVEPSLRLPAGWKFGTALDVAGTSGGVIDFASASLATLVDSPVLAGEHFRTIALSTAGPPVELAIAGDSEPALAAKPEFIAALRKLVDEAGALFGARHYDHYTFLLSLSDRLPFSGLEHHQSSDNRVGERALIDDAVGRDALDVLSHEYVHSWNGKYRRPAGLATPDFQTPMEGELLWVYEGLTQYYGKVLAARSGLWTAPQYRDALALIAASLDHVPGRAWRPLLDTAVAAQLQYRPPSEWGAERRGTDFYNEGWLIWLEADMLIRQATSGRWSLDDFCLRFFGGGGPPSVKPYTFDDVVTALDEVVSQDWRGFFRSRLESTGPHAPLGGIERGGWRLTYDGERSTVLKDREAAFKRIEMGYSLGLRLGTDGRITDVIAGMPAADAGLGPGMTVVAVDSRTFSPDVLREAVAAARPLRLLVDNGGTIVNATLDHHGGERYPHLVRAPADPDRLSETTTPRTANR
jgi:predicted metalloprotease with PDZ domain